MTNIGDGAKI